MMTKKKLLEQLQRIRVLETSFPVYSIDGVFIEKKTHVLLTYTPQDVPMADERYALGVSEIQELFGNVYDYVLNSTDKKHKDSRRAK